MSAETIPSDVLSAAREALAAEFECSVKAFPASPARARRGEMDHTYELKAIVRAILTDRATRPAEPAAPVAEAGGHPDAMRRPWELRSPTQIYGNLQRDQNGTADRVAVTTTHADAALIVEAVNAYSPLRSTLEAERARADAAEQRAADALARAEKAEGALAEAQGALVDLADWLENDCGAELPHSHIEKQVAIARGAPPRASREAQPATDGGEA